MTAPAACGVSAQVDAEVGDLLARQLDAFARVIGQRDQARRFAVALEQENAELQRQIEAAAKWRRTFRSALSCIHVNLTTGTIAADDLDQILKADATGAVFDE